MAARHFPVNLIYHPKGDLIHLFLSAVGRRVAVTLLYLFSSIYIFQSIVAFGVEEKLAIVFVILYYLLASIVKLITLTISENLSQKLGFKHLIWLSGIPFVLFIPTLVFVEKFPLLLILTGIFWGLHTGFFWWGYHGYFIKSGEGEHYGEGAGEADFLETTAIVLTPILGAFIATLFGFTIVFVLSGVIMVLALVLLGKDHERRQRTDIKFKEVLSLIKSHKSISLAYAGSQADLAIYYIFWPIFLFFFFGEVLNLGFVVSAAALIAALFAIAVGSWVDKQGERKIITLGTPVIIVSWIFRALGRSVSAFIFSDSLWNFGQRMVILPLNILTYKKALEGPSARAVLFRETASTIGIIGAYATAAVLVYFFGEIRLVFWAAAFFALFPVFAVIRHRLPGKEKRK